MSWRKGYLGSARAEARACALVVVLGSEPLFRAAVVQALTARGAATRWGALDGRVLSGLEGWHASWRPLYEVGALVLDVADDMRRGLQELEVIRRRDWTVPVMVVARRFGDLPARRLGANLVLEGTVDAREVAALALSLAQGREDEALAAADESEAAPSLRRRAPREPAAH